MMRRRHLAPVRESAKASPSSLPIPPKPPCPDPGSPRPHPPSPPRRTIPEDDLFWALCGGCGGNYGVVTALQFATEDTRDVSFTRLVVIWPATATATAPACPPCPRDRNLHRRARRPSSRAGPAVRGRGRGRDPSRTRVAAVVSGCRAGGSTDACVMLRAASRVARRFRAVLELVPSLTRAAVCAAASLLRSPEPDGPRLVAGDAEDVRAPRELFHQRISRARTSYSSLACCGRGGGDGGGMRTTARMAGGPAAGLRRGGPGTGLRRGDLRGRRTRRMGRRTRRMVKVGGR